MLPTCLNALDFLCMCGGTSTIFDQSSVVFTLKHYGDFFRHFCIFSRKETHQRCIIILLVVIYTFSYTFTPFCRTNELWLNILNVLGNKCCVLLSIQLHFSAQVFVVHAANTFSLSYIYLCFNSIHSISPSVLERGCIFPLKGSKEECFSSKTKIGVRVVPILPTQEDKWTSTTIFFSLNWARLLEKLCNSFLNCISPPA